MGLNTLPDCLINGEAGELLSIRDRAFQYGDGLFETLAIVSGQVRHWRRHLQRLRDGCVKLGLPLPDSEQLAEEAQSLIRDRAQGVLKIILSRGPGLRGYQPPENPSTTRILYISAMPDYDTSYQTKGIQLTVCNTPLGINPALAGIKHLNRLEQVLARGEWQDPAIQEGLMLDIDGYVIEGTMSNLFVVQGGKLVTPDLSRCGVAGITRQRIMEAARELGYQTTVRPLRLDEVKHSNEVFICNSLIGIWPVRQCEEQSWAVGPISRQLQLALEQERE